MSIKKQINTTVVIPTKGNRPDKLKRAVRRIFEGNVWPSRVIIVVDGELTQYNEVSMSMNGDPLVAVVRNGSKFNGVSATRNYGSQQVKTTYISFLDDDDYWEKEYLNEIFEETNFDLALVGFKKISKGIHKNEKAPPTELSPEIFLVKNPGIRGSNITISKKLFKMIGGFNEQLLAFNDMDFGIRLSQISNKIRYKAIDKNLVVFDAHNGERISTPGSIENRQGLLKFLELHGSKMTWKQEASYRKRAYKLWGFESHNLEFLRQHIKPIKDNPEAFVGQFDKILHNAETALLEKIWSVAEDADDIQHFIEAICQRYENFLPSRKIRYRISCTTTDSDGAIKRMVESLVEELAISQWNCKKEGTLFEILVIENSLDDAIANANQSFCNAFQHEKINIRYISWKDKDRFSKKPYSIVESRIYLIECLKKINWHASKTAPIWILDDDFEFRMTIPDKEKHSREIRVGSVFHRMECLINEGTADAIVGGNTGSFPIPELSTVRLQLMDILEFLLKSSTIPWEKTLRQIQNSTNYYYDLSREKTNYFPVIPFFWKQEYLNPDDFLEKMFYSLLTGTPTSRPLYANYVKNEDFTSAWEVNDESVVSGGNTLYVNDELLSTDDYYALQFDGLISRRSDAIWFLHNHQKGYRISKKNLAITHNRKLRDKKISKESVHKKALSDVLGVGLWEAIKESSPENISDIDRELVRKKIETRLCCYNDNIKLANSVLLDIEKVQPKVKYISYYVLLKDILSKLPEPFDYEKIEIVKYGNSV